MEPLEFGKVSVNEAREALEDERKRLVELLCKGQGAGPESRLLLDSTVTWIAGLPADVRPLELARQYPRIANGFAEIWGRVAQCQANLDSLVADYQSGRKAFPQGVAQDLATLKTYYTRLHRPSTR